MLRELAKRAGPLTAEALNARLPGEPLGWFEHETDLVLKELSVFGVVAARRHAAEY